MGLDTASNSVELIGGIQGLYQAGGLLGTLYVGLAGDKLGRRRAIFIASVVCVIGGALQTGSVHVAMFMAARFLSGLGTGMSPLCNAFHLFRADDEFQVLSSRSYLSGNRKSRLPRRVDTWSVFTVSKQVLKDGITSDQSLRQACSSSLGTPLPVGSVLVSTLSTLAVHNGVSPWPSRSLLRSHWPRVFSSCPNLLDGVRDSVPTHSSLNRS